MPTYEDALAHVYRHGSETDNRTGVGTIETFDGTQIAYDLRDGFPCITSKRVAHRLAMEEMLWFIKGDCDLRIMLDKNVHIWDDWCSPKVEMKRVLAATPAEKVPDGYVFILTEDLPDYLSYVGDYGVTGVYCPDVPPASRHDRETCEMWPIGSTIAQTVNRVLRPDSYLDSDPYRLIAYPSSKWYDKGHNPYDDTKKKIKTYPSLWYDLGPIYGEQWRHFNANVSLTSFDQLAWLMEELAENPNSRRLILSSWNPAEMDLMAIPPCPCFCQFRVMEGKYLDCHVYQRSADMFLGVPFDLVGYGLLLNLIAHSAGYIARNLIWTGGSTHIYNNSREQVQAQLDYHRENNQKLPKLEIVCDPKPLDKYTIDDIKLVDYVPGPSLKADVVP